MNKTKLKFGDRVYVTATAHNEYRTFLGRHYKVWRSKRLAKPIVGIVIRKTWKRGGKIHPGSYGQDGDYSGTELQLLRQYLVYEVAFDLHRKPILVKAKDLQVEPQLFAMSDADLQKTFEKIAMAAGQPDPKPLIVFDSLRSKS